MSLDGSIGKIEVDPKEEVSVVEVFQDVLDKLQITFFLTKKIGELMANISFDVIHLCQTILQCPKTNQTQCYNKISGHVISRCEKIKKTIIIQ
jgi:hypothetical protein